MRPLPAIPVPNRTISATATTECEPPDAVPPDTGQHRTKAPSRRITSLSASRSARSPAISASRGEAVNGVDLAALQAEAAVDAVRPVAEPAVDDRQRADLGRDAQLLHTAQEHLAVAAHPVRPVGIGMRVAPRPLLPGRQTPPPRSVPARRTPRWHAGPAADPRTSPSRSTGTERPAAGKSQAGVVGLADSAARRYPALMRWASSSWSSRMTMRQAASMGVPWSTSSRARAAMRSW